MTPLTSHAHPLFRNRLGDLAARRTHPCRCGRGLALMGPVEGRTTQIIRTGDGRALNSALMGACFSDYKEIRRWQAHQTGPNALRILLMTTPAWADRTRDAVLATARGLLGDGLRVDLVLVEEIPVAPNGKLQTMVPLPPHTPG